MLSITLIPLLAAQDGGLDLIEIDLSPSDMAAEKAIAYSGGLTQKAKGVGPGARINVTHTGGTVSVRCQSTDTVTATINYELSGTDPGALQTMGDGIGLAATGATDWATVSSRVPWRAPSIKEADIPLVVSVPAQANITVNANGGWIEVLKCEGAVTASTNTGGLFVSGTYSAVNVSAASGDVTVELSDESELKGGLRAIASGGNLKVEMPLTTDGRVQASGGSVSVLHHVDGSTSDRAVNGTIGAGGPALVFQASGSVEITSP